DDWKLYGETSALTLAKNFGNFKSIMENFEEHTLQGKLLYGSDYPIPSISFLQPVDDLIKEKYLDPRLKEPLDEIFSYNPLVFDFVVKRNIKHPKTGKKLPIKAFLAISDNGV
ncbi:hypothetical protein ACFL2A_05430, partial [Thermodesulfobacteriota bacterium]